MTDDLLKVVGEPVLWQWRRKSEPWSIHHTFYSQVFATTDDTEVRTLYTEAQVLALADAMKADGWRQCAKGQRTTQFCGQLEAEKAKAYAEGQEDMRERTKAACNQLEDDYLSGKQFDGMVMTEAAAACGACANIIGALPITEGE